MINLLQNSLMVVAVLASDAQQAEWQQRAAAPGVEWCWCGSVKTLVATVADLYIDLLYTPDPERNAVFGMRAGQLVLINSVLHTSEETGKQFVRINGWPGMLARPVQELALADSTQAAAVAAAMASLQWEYRLVPDIPGMVTPRVLAMIINEAYFTWSAGVSSKAEIDTAMKLGTGYPYGPFEWADKIGLEPIARLLLKLSAAEERYSPAPALLEAAGIQEKKDGPHFKY